MKLQVVPLPTNELETPFILVLSDVDDSNYVADALTPLKDQIGARAVLAFEDEVEVVPSA